MTKFKQYLTRNQIVKSILGVSVFMIMVVALVLLQPRNVFASPADAIFRPASFLAGPLAISYGGKTSASVPVGTGLWLADVCEPEGHPHLTWDTNHKNVGLYAGATAEGPWVPLGVNGPPWVTSTALLQQVAENFGLANYGDLWLKAGTGSGVLVDSVITDRLAHMDVLCGE